MNQKYLPNHIEYIRSIAIVSDMASITKKFNKRFKTNSTEASIKTLLYRQGITHIKRKKRNGSTHQK